jgi:hypothetical protein
MKELEPYIRYDPKLSPLQPVLRVTCQVRTFLTQSLAGMRLYRRQACREKVIQGKWRTSCRPQLEWLLLEFFQS